MVTRKLRELSDSEEGEKGDIQKIADTFHAFNEGTLDNEKGFCAIATLEDVAKQDYILTPGRYVGIAEVEDDGEPFQEKWSDSPLSYLTCLPNLMTWKKKFENN